MPERTVFSPETLKTKRYVFKEPVNSLAIQIAADKVWMDVEKGYRSILFDFSGVDTIGVEDLNTLWKLQLSAVDQLNTSLTIQFKPGSAGETRFQELAEAAKHHRVEQADECEIALAERGITNVNIENSDQLVKWVDEALTQNAKKIFINFAGVSCINAAGIMTLVNVQKKIMAQKAKLFILLPDQSDIYDLIKKNSLMEEFHIGFLNDSMANS